MLEYASPLSVFFGPYRDYGTEAKDMAYLTCVIWFGGPNSRSRFRILVSFLTRLNLTLRMCDASYVLAD